MALFASCWIAIVGLTGDFFAVMMGWMGILVGPLVATLLLAGAPIFAGSTVLPMAVALKSKDSAGDVGVATGRLYGLSTIGSVIGVLSTGYLLLPFLGVTGACLTGPIIVGLISLLAGKYKFGATTLAVSGCVIALTLAFKGIFPNVIYEPVSYTHLTLPTKA